MAFDDIAPIYDETRVIPNWVLNEFYNRALKKEIRSNPNLFILDAGIGTGRMVEPLLDLGVHLVGVDVSKNMLKKASWRLSERATRSEISLLIGDVTQLPFRNCSFDIVIASHLLDLLENWKQAIRETRRVLKPKSSFIATGHNCPEVDTKLGHMYLEILFNTLGPRATRAHGGAYESSSPIKGVLRRTLKILETNGVNVPKRILERISHSENWQVYLRRQARSRETCTLRWKERLIVSTIAERLKKRFLLVQSAISSEDYEKIMFELDRWRDGKMEKNPFLEMTREFTYIKVHF